MGSFVSEMTWLREQNGVVSATEKLTTADLDYLIDPKANTIGALMLHLAATETYYQLNTFDGKKWGAWPDSVKQQWDAAMNLGDAGRKTIKGHDLGYYLNALHETRAKTLAEFSKRDDAWFMAVDKDWPWGPTNNYCKWFHVCEHEAHHTGQILGGEGASLVKPLTSAECGGMAGWPLTISRPRLPIADFETCEN